MKEKKSFCISKKQKTKMTRALILLLFLSCLVALLNRVPWAASSSHLRHGNTDYQEPAWTLKQGEQILEEGLTTPAFRHLKAGETYAISAALTYDGREDQVPACFFFVDHMFCRVSLEGQELFRYMKEENGKADQSRSPGNVYVFVNLPRDCQGKELTIEFIPALSDSVEFQLPNPVFGDYASQLNSIFWRDLPHNIETALFLFLGIGSVLFATLVLPGAKYREGMFIGIFAVLISCYNLTESDFMFYSFSNPYYTYVLDYTTFSLIPVFLLAFLRERMDDHEKPLALAVIYFEVGLFILEMVLHFGGIMDMREFLPNIHVAFFVSFFIYLVLILKIKDRKCRFQLIGQLAPILAGMILDAAVYYEHWQLDSSDSSFTCFGILLFVLAEIRHVWKYTVEAYTLSEKSRDYMQMAYVDALTGIGNRRAFDAEKRVILSGKREFHSVLIASADLNNLKVTNDTMGHAAGDFLIRSAAQVLAGLSDQRCHAFRMGGDEFTVLIYDMEAEAFELCLEQMYDRIAQINSKSEVKLSLAIGYDVIHTREVEKAILRADQKMYQDKSRIKASWKNK